jgi:phage tail-like protein
MAVIGQHRGYHKRFLFAIEIDGLEVGWFTTCSSLEAELGVVEQHEGGLIGVADQAPGKLKWTPVTLTIGATNNNELYEWWLLVVDAAANAGEPDDAYKKNVAIVQKDRDGSELRRHNLTKAWPSKFVFGSWDANAEENVMEEITLNFLYAARQQVA